MKTAGSQCDAFVEYVDLFPTVLDLCGAEVPQYMEGTSFAPLLKSPSTVWKKAVFSQFPRRADIDGRKKNIEGYSVRTKYFRFTQWRARETSNVVFEEFYDNRKNDIEDKNHAANPKFKAHVDQHRHLLRNGWKRALPPGVENSSNLPKGNDAWYFHPTKRQPTKKSKNP